MLLLRPVIFLPKLGVGNAGFLVFCFLDGLFFALFFSEFPLFGQGNAAFASPDVFFQFGQSECSLGFGPSCRCPTQSRLVPFAVMGITKAEAAVGAGAVFSGGVFIPANTGIFCGSYPFTHLYTLEESELKLSTTLVSLFCCLS